jgi:hypothetical protein
LENKDFSLNSGIRTIMHLSPVVCAAAMIAVNKHGLSLQEWLDHHVSYALADDYLMADGLDVVAPWSLSTAELFLQVANSAPEALRGRWALLYRRVQLERSLWHEPAQTVGDLEDEAPTDEPYISTRKLRTAWPRLCAATSVCED